MHLCHLTYRLKGESKITRLSFESFEAANTHLIENGLQCVVGQLKGIENPHVIIERAAHTSKADWHEFSHTEE